MSLIDVPALLSRQMQQDIAVRYDELARKVIVATNNASHLGKGLPLIFMGGDNIVGQIFNSEDARLSP